MEVIAWSQNLTAEKAQACGARLVSREELFRGADILTIHLVLSQRTKGLVGAAELQAMKPSARLINTSRGPIVDEPALIDVLRKRRIAGAALDVFDVEPLPADHLSGRWITSWRRRTSVSSPESSTGRSTAIRSRTSSVGWPSSESLEMPSWPALRTKRRLSPGPRGIGRATAEALAEMGARVIVHYGRSAAEADTLVGKIRAAGGSADAAQADLAVPGGAGALAEQVRAIVGQRLDIFVSNAGISKAAAIEGHTIDDFDGLFATNVRSPFFLVKELLPLFREGSSIVVVTSLAARAAPAVPVNRTPRHSLPTRPRKGRRKRW